jgi:hypothetical protein
MAFSDEVVRIVPCYELEFTLDGKKLYQALIGLKKCIKKGSRSFMPGKLIRADIVCLA